MTEASNQSEMIAPLARRIEQTLAGKLISLTLYGSVARGTASAASTDVNLLIVLSESNTATLAALREDICSVSDIRISPYIIRASELPQLADLFATRLLEMKRGYQVLAGQDVLAGLQMNEQTLRIRIAQELLNSAIRLRGELLKPTTPDSLEQDLEAFFQPFLKTLRSLIFVRTGEHIESRRELIEKAVTLFTLDRDALLQLSAWRSGRVSFTDAERLAATSALLESVEQVIEKTHA